MSAADEPRTPPSQPPAPSDRESRIDELLMAGLDEYFAGRYERAVQVWSRVYFLDRAHPRARAYIDRARGAIAERQREAEAGVAGRDESLESRDATLLRLADAGTPPPAVVGSLAAQPRPAADPDDLPSAAASIPRVRSQRAGHIAHALLFVVAGVLLFVAGYMVAARDDLAEWWLGRTPAAAAVREVPAAAPAEVSVNLARQHMAAGRFQEARRALDAIAVDDPLRKQADALLAELRQMLRGAEGRRLTPSPLDAPAARPGSP